MKIHLRSFHGTYVVAEGGGGGAVNADRVMAQSWETWEVRDPYGYEWGSTLSSGDVILLVPPQGRALLADWSGGTVNATGYHLPGATLRVVKTSGSSGTEIRDGDEVGLSSPTKMRLPSRGWWDIFRGSEWKWVTARAEMPRPLVVIRQIANPESWEKFRLFYVRRPTLQPFPTPLLPPAAGIAVGGEVRLDRAAPPGRVRISLDSGVSGVDEGLGDTNLRASISPNPVEISEGEASAQFRVFLSGQASACKPRVWVSLRAQTSALSDWNEGISVTSFDVLPRHEFLNISQSGTLQRNRTGTISVQIWADAPLPRDTEYILELSAPADLMKVNDGPRRVFLRQGDSPSVGFSVTPLVDDSLPSGGAGICVTATIKTSDGKVVTREQQPFRVPAVR